jgi:hypothetical protein
MSYKHVLSDTKPDKTDSSFEDTHAAELKWGGIQFWLRGLGAIRLIVANRSSGLPPA